MRSTNHLRLTSAFALLGGFIASSVALSTEAGAQPIPTSNARALFIETDSLAGNSILTYLRGSDGTISLAGSYATGG